MDVFEEGKPKMSFIVAKSMYLRSPRSWNAAFFFFAIVPVIGEKLSSGELVSVRHEVEKVFPPNVMEQLGDPFKNP